VKIRFREVTAKRTASIAGMMGATVALAWVLFVGLPRWHGRPKAAAGSAPAAESAPGRKIKASLYYVSDDGAKLTGVEREVPYGEGTVEQAKAIVTAQIASVAEPLVSAIPPGTMLRAHFVTPQGEAYLDLSGEFVKAHPGGSLNELLTIYTLVDALTTNLPAVTAVQVLVDGKQIDTLAGHIDLRRRLVKNLSVVE
jgi:hypothetical protein